MRFSIDKEVLERMLNYVITKPYNEVAQLITATQSDIKAIEEPKPEDEKEGGE